MNKKQRNLMVAKKILSLTLILAFLLSPTGAWCQPAGPSFLPSTTGTRNQPAAQQNMEEQARFYLQRIVPEATSGQPPEQRPQVPAYETKPAKILTAAPRLPEETSAIEKRAAENGMAVKQFGYSFFYKPPETFLPVQNIPVGPNYVIGPGDTIHILLWGNVQGEYNVTVDRNGTILIPVVGVVHVSGLTYQQLREVLEKEFSRQYTKFQMSVTLDNLRTIQVFVVGQARFPGSYAVSSLSTLVSALFAAGGPSKSGSMRNIEVRRGKRVVVHFDMYDFLLRGDKSKDIRLQPEDVIFIPPIGDVAAIGSPVKETAEAANLAQRLLAPLGKNEKQALTGRKGNELLAKELAGPTPGEELPPAAAPVSETVKVPGIYELKNERTLLDLIRLAGGLADMAFKGRVQVLRVKAGREMILFEDDLGKVLSRRIPDLPLVDGDLVKIFPVPGQVEKKVMVAGAVKNPGEFGIKAGMRVKDLIDYAGGLLMQANRDQAEITRVTVTPEGPETTRLYISPRLALAGTPHDNILLQPNDYLFVRTVPDWHLYQLVQIGGEVNFPGSYAIKKGETLSSLLARAGGLTSKAFPKGAVFTRVAVRDLQAEQLKQALDRIEAEMMAQAAAKTQTELAPEEAKQQQIYVKQQQLLLAKLREVVPLGRVVIRLDDPERLRGTPWDLELQDGDKLVVPQVQQTVSVLGAVVNPTGLIYDPYATVNDYLLRAGGATKYADAKGTYIIKVGGAAISRRSFGWFGGPVAAATTTTYHLGSFNSLRMDPGDTIVVPEELERIAWLREIKDIAVIIGQIALTAGVVLVGLR